MTMYVILRSQLTLASQPRENPELKHWQFLHLRLLYMHAVSIVCDGVCNGVTGGTCVRPLCLRGV